MRRTVLALALVLLLPPAAALAIGAPESGPDVPTATAPIATVVVLDHQVFSGAPTIGNTISVPTGWNRVTLTWDQTPLGDPWDRTFSASLGGVEVLRGTTPRTHFTITKDVTRYGTLLPAGGSALVEGYADSWVGAQQVTLTLSFYADPTSPLVEPAAAHVYGVDRLVGLGVGGAAAPVAIDFGPTAPASATVELFLSGHGDQEDWFLFPESPPTFHVLVDGNDIGEAVAMPYTYAFLGFCSGPGCSGTPADMQKADVMWWTAQQGADIAGVHTGVGEIPPYRIDVAAADLPLLQGARTVQLTLDHDALGQADGYGVWVSSASILTR